MFKYIKKIVLVLFLAITLISFSGCDLHGHYQFAKVIQYDLSGNKLGESEKKKVYEGDYFYESKIYEKFDLELDGYTLVYMDNYPYEVGGLDIDVHAYYADSIYSLTYLDDGGNILNSETIGYDASLSGVTAPTAPEREWYTFDGWDTVLPDKMPAENLVITAVYTPNTYTLTYIDNEEVVIQTESFIMTLH